MTEYEIGLAKIKYQILCNEQKRNLEDNEAILQAFSFLKLSLNNNPTFIYIETYVEDADYNVSYNSYFARYSVYMDLESSRFVEVPVAKRELFETSNKVIFLSDNPKEACKQALDFRLRYLKELLFSHKDILTKKLDK